MRLLTESRISGEFSGWDGNAVFTFVNGEKWQQAKFAYKYRYKYMPKVKVWEEAGQHFLEVDGMTEMIRIRRVS